MRLWFHPESDSLFWSEEWPSDGLCEDVTDQLRFFEAAQARGIPVPPEFKGVPASEIIIDQAPHTMAKAITDSYKKWERKPADLYPTPVDGTESLIPVLETLGVKRIWEPACGDGRLARVLEWHGFEVVATDIRDYPGYGIGGIDFLNTDVEKEYGLDLGQFDMIVTNPPFSLAEAFIRKALSITPKCAMLLKQTYWNTKGRQQLWREHMPDLELKMTWRLAFLKNERGNSPLMDCMWNVWTGENANLQAAGMGPQSCTAEPLSRRKYPGYDGIGVKSAMQVLEGELAGLADDLDQWRKLLP